MAIDTVDKIVTGLGAGRDIFWYKTTSTTTVAGDLVSLMQIGGVPALPAIPSSVAAVCTSTTPGAGLGMPGTTGEHYVAAAWVAGTAINSFMLYDRLMHCGNLVGNSTVVQAVAVTSTAAFDSGRASSIIPLEWFVEWYTTTGATAVTCNLTCSYTDGSSGTVTIAWAATRRQSQLARIMSTVTGAIIQSIDTVYLTTTSGTAGSFGITAAKRLCDCPIFTANIAQSFDFAEIGLPKINGNSCLWWACNTAATAIGVSQMKVKIVST